MWSSGWTPTTRGATVCCVRRAFQLILGLAVALSSLPLVGGISPVLAAAGKCRALTEDQVNTLELKVGADISSGVARKVPLKKRNSERWPSHLVAAEIAGSEPGVWAIGGVTSYSLEGPIDSLNDAAWSATDFGAEPGSDSPAEDQRERLAGLKQYRQVLKCLASGGGHAAESDPSDEEFRQQMIDRFGPETVYEDGSRQDYVSLAKDICSQSDSERRTLRQNLGPRYEGSIQQFIIEDYCDS